MKLLKPEGQQHWHVEVETEDGSKRLINTECLTKSEAQALCEAAKVKDLEQASKKHRLTSEVVTLITANRVVTVNDVIAEWDEWMKTASRSDKTRDNNLASARQWARDMNMGDKPIARVASGQIHKWINDPDDPGKRGTRMNKLTHIRNLMQFATIKRYILSDPSRLVSVDHRILDHEQKETTHKRVFTDQEIEFLLAKTISAADYVDLTSKAESDLKRGSISKGEYSETMKEIDALVPEPPIMTPGFFNAAIIIGRDIGIRLIDICCLEWKQFNLEDKKVTVWQQKTGARIELPITDRVIELVKALPRLSSKYLFPKERDRSMNTKLRPTLSTAFSLFFQRNGFPDHSFHGLRATLATTMASQGMTMEDIAKALGQKGKSATPAYVRVPGAALVSKR